MLADATPLLASISDDQGRPVHSAVAVFFFSDGKRTGSVNRDQPRRKSATREIPRADFEALLQAFKPPPIRSAKLETPSSAHRPTALRELRAGTLTVGWLNSAFCRPAIHLMSRQSILPTSPAQPCADPDAGIFGLHGGKPQQQRLMAPRQCAPHQSNPDKTRAPPARLSPWPPVPLQPPGLRAIASARHRPCRDLQRQPHHCLQR
jgi:hypothetical protein